MAAVIAHVTGTALAPGVSRNGRLYTREAIARAVARAQARIADGKRPISMRSHHAAGDDSTHIVGRVTDMWQDPDTGKAKYRAAIADTDHGRTIAALTDDTDGQPQFLRGVSIRGAWMEAPRTETVDGREVSTADDLEIAGLDYTGEPGVDDADVSHAPEPPPPGESTSAPFPITESAPEALVSLPAARAEPIPLNELTEKGAPALKSGKPAAAQTKAKSYADPGYQDDRMKRYALDTRSEALAAWRYLHQKDNADNYTANQLKRIKQRIAKALKGFGVKVDPTESYLILPVEQLTESADLAECMGYCDGDEQAKGSFYVTLTNGPVSVSVSSYRVEPADLDLIGRAAMDGACKALATLDPDMDGDIDVPGASAEDTDPEGDGDEDLEQEPSAHVPGTACPCGCGCAVPVLVADCPCVCGDCAVCGSTGNESAPAATGPAESAPTPQTPADSEPAAAAGNPAPPQDAVTAPLTETEDLVTETTTAVESAAPAEAPAAPAAANAPQQVVLSNEQFQQLLAAAAARPVAEAVQPAAPAAAPPAASPAAIAAPAMPAPAPAPVAETEEARIARIVAESQRALLANLAESGLLPGRRGLAGPAGAPGAPAAENSANSHGLPAGWPDKPLHQFSTEELNRYAGPVVFEHAVGHYAHR